MGTRHAAPRTLQTLTLQRPRHCVPPMETAPPGAGGPAKSSAPHLRIVHSAHGSWRCARCLLQSPFQQPGAGYPSTNLANSFWSQCRNGLTSAGPKGQAEPGCSWQASERAAELTRRQPGAKSELFTICCTHNFKSRSRLQP